MLEPSNRATLRDLYWECCDTNAQKKLTKLLTYALCHLKVTEPFIEGSIAMFKAHRERQTGNQYNDENNPYSDANIHKLPFTFRFLQYMIGCLRTGSARLKGADQKKKLVALLQLFYDVMVHDKETVIRDPEELAREEEKKQSLIDTSGAGGRPDEKPPKRTTKYAYDRNSPAFKRGVQIYDVFSSGVDQSQG